MSLLIFMGEVSEKRRICISSSAGRCSSAAAAASAAVGGALVPAEDQLRGKPRGDSARAGTMMAAGAFATAPDAAVAATSSSSLWYCIGVGAR
jgi:hypothetical protein